MGREEGASQLRNLREIDIHPMEPPVINPLELGRQAGPEAEHLSVGVMVKEVAQEPIQDQTTLDQAPQHLPVGFEPGEVIIEPRGDGFRGWISKALVRKEAAGKRAGSKGNEQGLLDAAQTCNAVPRV